MATLTEVTVQDTLPSDLFTARIPDSHAIMLVNRGTLRTAPVYELVAGDWVQTGSRLEIRHEAFILYIQEVAL